jgi:hypothetical protein
MKMLLIYPTKMDYILKPVCAFITFETEFAANEALNYQKWL